MEILDIGCGHTPKGDVNVDLFVEATSHRHIEVCYDKPLATRKIPNFVRADACYLPFRARTFRKVVLYEVLEHVNNAMRALTEVNHVLFEDGEVELSIPNAMYWRCMLRWTVKGMITISATKHISCWRLPEIQNLLRITDFRMVEVGFIDTYGDRPSTFANVLPRITKHSMLVRAVKVGRKDDAGLRAISSGTTMAEE